jgi:hypothetical protein
MNIIIDCGRYIEAHLEAIANYFLNNSLSGFCVDVVVDGTPVDVVSFETDGATVNLYWGDASATCSADKTSLVLELTNILSDSPFSAIGADADSNKVWTMLSNIYYLKMLCYLRAFLLNECDDGYDMGCVNSDIIGFDYTQLSLLTLNNFNEILNDALFKIDKSIVDVYSVTSKEKLEACGMVDDDLVVSSADDVLSLVEWDVFGAHGKYPDEAELPTVCQRFLEALLSLYHHEPCEDDEYRILVDYEITCADDVEVDYICSILDCYVDVRDLAIEIKTDNGIPFAKQIEYIQNVVEFQCIEFTEAYRIWRDYLHMAKDIKLNISKASLKYPESLKLSHDKLKTTAFSR